MRFLTLLALSLVSLAFHRAYATTLPTLCTAEEKALISGETPRGFASLCAGKNDVWHYRFGEPEHITYVFPRDNSPAKKNFSADILNYGRNQGGSIFFFQDHGRDIYIFDALRTVWGNQRNIMGRMAGIRIKDPKRHHAVDLPFARLAPEGETSWQINQKPPFASLLGTNLYIWIHDHHLEQEDTYWLQDTRLDPNYNIIKPYGPDPSDTPYMIYNVYNEFEASFVTFTQEKIRPKTVSPLLNDEAVSLCTSVEKIILSGQTANGNYASLCANGTYWQYRFGKPNHITYFFPNDHQPARNHFDYAIIHPHRVNLPERNIPSSARFRFTDHHTTFTIFTSNENIVDDDITLVGGIIVTRPRHSPHYITFKHIGYESSTFAFSLEKSLSVPKIPNNIMQLEPRNVTHTSPFSVPSIFLHP